MTSSKNMINVRLGLSQVDSLYLGIRNTLYMYTIIEIYIHKY